MTLVNRTFAATAREVAEGLADTGIRLDGSEASLQGLDEAIDLLWGEAAPPPEYFDGMVWGYGCYVADVIQRHCAGRWVPADEMGYDFIPAGGTARINPWQWVEDRLRGGGPIAPQYAAEVQQASRATTDVSVQGAGKSFACMAIDGDSFRLLTQLGIAESDYNAMIDDAERRGLREEGLLIDGLTVAVNGEVFACSWDKIQPQLADQCLLTQKLYQRLSLGEYLFVYEQDFVGRWDELGVEDYDHSQLRFNVGRVEPSRGMAYALMDFTFTGDAPSVATSYSEGGEAYVVDRAGRRHAIKVTYEW